MIIKESESWKVVERNVNEWQTTMIGVLIGNTVLEIGDIKFEHNLAIAELIAEVPNMLRLLKDIGTELDEGEKKGQERFSFPAELRMQLEEFVLKVHNIENNQ